MSYVIACRNPSSKKLFFIMDGEGWSGGREGPDELAEFDTEQAALDTAKRMPCCDAWGYNIVEVP